MKFFQQFLKEAPLEDVTVRLTDTQKSVLVSIYAAATPELAFNYTIGAENVVQASEALRSFGLIEVNTQTTRAGVTDTGQAALFNINYVDDIGELTDAGQQAVSEQDAVRQDFLNATESVKYSVLNQLI